MQSGLGNCVALDQNVFTAEFIVRIASFRRVAVRLDAVMEIENLGRISECIVDLFFRPNIEGAFGGLLVVGSIDSNNAAVSVLGGEKAPFFRRHVASDVIENVA